MGRRKYNSDFGRACGNFWQDVKCTFNKNKFANVAYGLCGPWPPIRIAILGVMFLVLLFSGISITSWLILGILAFLLNFC